MKLFLKKYKLPFLYFFSSLLLFSSFQNCSKLLFIDDKKNNTVTATNFSCQYADFSLASIQVFKVDSTVNTIDPNSLLINDTATFKTNNSEPGMTYDWTVAITYDARLLMPNPPPSHSSDLTLVVPFNFVGRYEVSLKIKRSGCSNESQTITRSIAITPIDNACPSLSALKIDGSTAGIPGQSLAFSLAIPATCNHSTVWDLDELSLVAYAPGSKVLSTLYSQDYISHIFKSSGIYIAKATVTYTGSGSRKNFYKTVTMNSGTTCDLDTLNILGPQNLAANQPGTFSLAVPWTCSAQNFSWTWGDNSSFESTALNGQVFSAAHAWSSPGSYTVQGNLTYIVNGETKTRAYTLPVKIRTIAGCSCTTSDFDALDIYGPTEIRVGLAENFKLPTLNCLGTATWDWTFGSGSSPGIETNNPTSTSYSAPGAKEISLQITSPTCGNLVRKFNLSVNSSTDNPITCSPGVRYNPSVPCGPGFNGGTKFTTTTTTCPDGLTGLPVIYTSGYNLYGCPECPMVRQTFSTPTCGPNQTAIVNSVVTTTNYSCATGIAVPTTTSTAGSCTDNPITCTPGVRYDPSVPCGPGFNGGTKFTTTTTTCPDGLSGLPVFYTSDYNLYFCVDCPRYRQTYSTPICGPNQTAVFNSIVTTTNYSCATGTAVATTFSTAGTCLDNP